MPLLALALLATTVAFVAVAPAAGACSCASSTDDEAFARSAVVFAGVVTDHQLPAEVQTSADPATWTFAVSTVYKGDALESQPVESAMSGASCGLEIQVGGEYLVFADRDGPVTANLCGGTRQLAAAAVPDGFGGGSAPTGLAEAGPPGGAEGGSGPWPVLAVALVAGALAVGAISWRARLRRR